jgi:chemotaxis protein MotB
MTGKLYKSLCLTVVSAFVISGCVPTSKFNDLKEQNDRIITERDQLFADKEQLDVRNTELEARIGSIESEIADIEEEKVNVQGQYDDLKAEYDILKRRYDDLEETQEALLSGHNRETKRLLTELQAAQQDLVAKEDRLLELEKSAAQKMQDVERLRAELEERNRRLIELEDILYTKDSLMNALKNTISDALYGFQKDGLSVSFRNGKVYVSMEEKLLFQTGSIEVDPRGVNALKQLAPILEETPDIYITIEGHTDDVPVRSNASFRDNWDLSVKRATSIVRILLENSSIDPQRLIASGRSKYLPVDTADNPEARQKNRRTEIILTPDLDELYRLIEDK